jgi:hypothetical protein
MTVARSVGCNSNNVDFIHISALQIRKPVAVVLNSFITSLKSNVTQLHHIYATITTSTMKLIIILTYTLDILLSVAYVLHSELILGTNRRRMRSHLQKCLVCITVSISSPDDTA